MRRAERERERRRSTRRNGGEGGGPTLAILLDHRTLAPVSGFTSPHSCNAPARARQPQPPGPREQRGSLCKLTGTHILGAVSMSARSSTQLPILTWFSWWRLCVLYAEPACAMVTARNCLFGCWQKTGQTELCGMLPQKEKSRLNRFGGRFGQPSKWCLLGARWRWPTV